MAPVLSVLYRPIPALRSLLGDAGAFTVLTTSVLFAVSVPHQLYFKNCWDGGLYPERRLQPGKKGPEDIIRAIRGASPISAFFSLAGYFAVLYALFVRWFMDLKTPPPPFIVALRKLFVAMCVCDMTFYSYHRAQHELSPVLYRLLHKTHHNFYVVTPEASSWEAPFEPFVLFLTIDIIPAWAARMDIVTYLLWRALNTYRHEHFHCGYDFNWFYPNLLPYILITAGAHDFHHAQNSGMYALWFRVLDWAFGTDKAYTRWIKARNTGATDGEV